MLPVLRLFLLGTLMLLQCSCAHTYNLSSMDDKDARAFEKRSSTQVFLVHFVNGVIVRGVDLSVRAETLHWSDASTGQESEAISSEVLYVEFADRVSGGVEGFMYGFLVGAAAGSVIGSGSGQSAFMGTALLGLSVGGIGALFGVIGGTKDRYYPSH